MQRRWVGVVGGVLVLAAMGIANAPTAVAHGDPCTARNLRSGTTLTSGSGWALMRTIADAAERDTIEVRGRCVGVFRISTSLELVGRPRRGRPVATMSGRPDRATLVVESGAHVVIRSMRISHDGDVGTGEAARGVVNRGTLALTQVTVNENAASTGGGILNDGRLRIVRSTVSSNVAAELGGGIHNRGRLWVQWSTLAENTSNGDGGALANDGVLRISHSTIARNSTAWTGGGVSTAISGDGSPRATFEASIFALNQAGASGPDCAGDVTSNGYNFVGTTDGFFCAITARIGDRIDERGPDGGFVDPALGPLAANGGPTRTIALDIGSIAIDAIPGDALGADGVTVLCRSGMRDQRGRAAPASDACDIGAFERSPTDPVL